MTKTKKLLEKLLSNIKANMRHHADSFSEMTAHDDLLNTIKEAEQHLTGAPKNPPPYPNHVDQEGKEYKDRRMG